jgi:hypothetical protein
MATTKERTELREELVSQGYSWEYIDEWQPKVALYLHKAKKNPSGDVVNPVGAKLVNLPGNPDYVNRKARLGLFPWPPNDACTCRWCAEVAAGQTKVEKPVRPAATRSPKLGPYYNSES